MLCCRKIEEKEYIVILLYWEFNLRGFSISSLYQGKLVPQVKIVIYEICTFI